MYTHTHKYTCKYSHSYTHTRTPTHIYIYIHDVYIQCIPLKTTVLGGKMPVDGSNISADNNYINIVSLYLSEKYENCLGISLELHRHNAIVTRLHDTFGSYVNHKLLNSA